ncbi:hypothetical protein [Vibrio hepatarius]|uniref:hypothetical protein n=1 Tax=Vibrio hepatarius TaxID=171383 RepID=UPI002FDB74E6
MLNSNIDSSSVASLTHFPHVGHTKVLIPWLGEPQELMINVFSAAKAEVVVPMHVEAAAIKVKTNFFIFNLTCYFCNFIF